jgi:hypothetical protein
VCDVVSGERESGIPTTYCMDARVSEDDVRIICARNSSYLAGGILSWLLYSTVYSKQRGLLVAFEVFFLM